MLLLQGDRACLWKGNFEQIRIERLSFTLKDLIHELTSMRAIAAPKKGWLIVVGVLKQRKPHGSFHMKPFI